MKKNNNKVVETSKEYQYSKIHDIKQYPHTTDATPFLLPPEDDIADRQVASMEHLPNAGNAFSLRFTYEEAREKNKLGLPMAIIFLIKSAFGIGVFTSCYGFAKAGYLLGAICCIFLCYITTYGMWAVGK